MSSHESSPQKKRIPENLMPLKDCLPSGSHHWKTSFQNIGQNNRKKKVGRKKPKKNASTREANRSKKGGLQATRKKKKHLFLRDPYKSTGSKEGCKRKARNQPEEAFGGSSINNLFSLLPLSPFFLLVSSLLARVPVIVVGVSYLYNP